jgi:cytidine deaminase
MLTEKQKRELHKRAREASQNSYSPYSNYPAGAAVLTKDKRVFLGTNVENALFCLTICAERAALCNAASNGATGIEAIAVHAHKGDILPCGACRLFIHKFGEDIEVIYSKDNCVASDLITNLIPKSSLDKERK